VCKGCEARNLSKFLFLLSNPIYLFSFSQNPSFPFSLVLKVIAIHPILHQEWDCLLQTLSSIGFRPKWLSWIKVWLHSAKLSVLVNGSPGKMIKCRRGLRQGHPLSPLLFILVVDGLNCMIVWCKDHGLLQGPWFKVSVSAGTETDRSRRHGSDSDETRKTLHRTPKQL